MSNDARYLLHYEMQNYAGRFPQTQVDKLNNYSGITWMQKLHRIDSYSLDYYGETKHTHSEKIRCLSSADQVLECRDGENWQDITRST